MLQEQLGGVLNAGDAQLDNTMFFSCDVGERLGYVFRTSGEEDASVTIPPREVFQYEIDRLAGDVIDHEEPSSRIEVLQPTLCGRESGLVVGGRAVWMGHELEQFREALMELFDGRGLHPKDVRVEPFVVQVFRQRVEDLRFSHAVRTVEGTAGRDIAVQDVEELDDECHFWLTAGEVNAEKIKWGVVERWALDNVFR